MAQFGTLYQDGQLIAAHVQMARREEEGSIGPRWRIQAILPRPIASLIAEEFVRRPIYQIKFEGQTDDYFVVGHPNPLGSDPQLLQQDFLSLDLSSRYKSD